MSDLVERNETYYKKFSNKPFSGTVSGKWQGEIKNGKRSGKWAVFYDNGQLYYSVGYKDGKMEGKYHHYGMFGDPYVVLNYKNGMLQGKQKLLKNAFDAITASGEGFFNNGTPEGIFIEYDAAKTILWKALFKNGQCVKVLIGNECEMGFTYKTTPVY